MVHINHFIVLCLCVLVLGSIMTRLSTTSVVKGSENKEIKTQELNHRELLVFQKHSNDGLDLASVTSEKDLQSVTSEKHLESSEKDLASVVSQNDLASVMRSKSSKAPSWTSKTSKRSKRSKSSACAPSGAPSAQPIIYSGSFTTKLPASTDACNNWGTFLNSLNPGVYASVTMSGSEDITGVTCCDNTMVNQIATALKNRVRIGPISCNGRDWWVGVCGPVGPGCGVDSMELTSTTSSLTGTCNCDSGYTIRPSVGDDPSWGGINGATCSANTQTMQVVFA
mmetsp:Transcript_24369/g.44076  ORF Transcript_24369/g.44076 Transcript_24369/m.44076 type:complete len:282 (-) Transcript_24369:243-1088(-)